MPYQGCGIRSRIVVFTQALWSEVRGVGQDVICDRKRGHVISATWMWKAPTEMTMATGGAAEFNVCLLLLTFHCLQSASAIEWLWSSFLPEGLLVYLPKYPGNSRREVFTENVR